MVESIRQHERPLPVGGRAKDLRDYELVALDVGGKLRVAFRAVAALLA